MTAYNNFIDRSEQETLVAKYFTVISYVFSSRHKFHNFFYFI